MKVLVIGAGGREHTLAWKLRQSPSVTELYCAPGNAGTARIAQNLSLDPNQIDPLCEFALSHQIDLTVVGPEAPLVAGLVDRFREKGLLVAGPSAQAARLEGSKAFAKDFMARHQIPTAAYQVCSSPESAEETLQRGAFSFPVVVKADGLAAGKGVFICRNLDEARAAVDSIMRQRIFGQAGDRLVIEEFLQGEEASFMALSDGRNLLPLVPSQDHKAIYEEDRGPNTGGMGAYSMDELLPEEMRRRILERVITPAIQGLEQEGTPFNGVLYAGLMLTQEGPKVLEFNVRLGDPETQVVLPRLKSDLAQILYAVAQGDISGLALQWDPRAAVCVVIASRGYPGSYQTGREISGLEMAEEDADTLVFHAGTAEQAGKIVSAGGRVLGVTALAPSLEGAIIKAYEGVNKIRFEGMYYRRDIAAKGLTKLERIRL